MRCPECDSPNIESARSCAFCGGLLPGSPAPEDTTIAAASHATAAPPHTPVAPNEAVCDCCGAPMAAGREMCEACEQAFSSVLGAHDSDPAPALDVHPPRERDGERCAAANEPLHDPTVREDSPELPEPWWKVQRRQAPPPRPRRIPTRQYVAVAPVAPFTTSVAIVKRTPITPVRIVSQGRTARGRRRLVRPAFVAAALVTVVASLGVPAAYQADLLSTARLTWTAIDIFALVNRAMPTDEATERAPSTQASDESSDTQRAAADSATAATPTTPAPRASSRSTSRSRRSTRSTAPKKSSPAEEAPVAAPEEPLLASAPADATLLTATAPVVTTDRAAVVLAGPALEPTKVDVRPDVLSRVAPRLPSHLRGRQVEDVVVLRVLVSANGRASDVRVLRASRLDGAIDTAATDAVRQWRFSPAQKDGQAVSCWFSVGVPIRSPN